MLKKNSNVYAIIVEEIQNVDKCLVCFEGFLHAAMIPETPRETLNALRADVSKAENAADDSLRSMILSLSKGSYLPSTREELIDLGNSCDRIANRCERVANLIVLYRFRFPNGFSEDILKIIEITKKQLSLLQQAIGKLFSEMNHLQKDPSILDEIRALESQVDTIEFDLSQRIFDLDVELAARMQFFELLEKICDMSDMIEDIADKIQIMLITRKV